MRKNHTRWIALAGAATMSVAGLGAVHTPAAADDSPLAWPVVEQNASTYSLDGFEIGYLPPGLDRFGIHANSSSSGDGERTSRISWVQGTDAVYGRLTVIRSADIGELSDMRKSRYGHVKDASLKETENNGSDAYVSEETGDLFWVPEDGVGVAAYLQPDRWETEELASFSEGVRQREAPEAPGQPGEQEDDADSVPEDVPEVPEEVPEAGSQPGDTPDAEVPEAAGEVPGAEIAEDVEGSFVPGVSLMDVRTCLAEELEAEDSAAAPADVARDDARLLELWESVGSDTQGEAARRCAARFEVEPAQIERMLTELAAQAEQDADSGDADAAQEGEQEAASRAAENAKETGDIELDFGAGDEADRPDALDRPGESEQSEESEEESEEPLGLWDSLRSLLPGLSIGL